MTHEEQIQKLNKEITDMSAVFGAVNAEIVAERDARMAAEDRLSEIDDILHAGEDVPTVEAATFVMGRVRALVDAIEARYTAVATARACGEDVPEYDMMAYDQAILGAKDACIRFFDDEAEI
jgi:hypothetical protein